MLTIENKILGQSGKTISHEIECPQAWSSAQTTTNLRAVLTHVVTEEVEAFHQRQMARLTALPILTAEEIAQGEKMGKIGYSNHPIQMVSVEKAIARAVEAFEDGLVFAFVDGQQAETLDLPFYITPTSTITFLRLTALVGG